MSSARKSFFGFLTLVPIALLSAAACGGNAIESRNGVNGSAGSSSAGGGASSAGGNASFAGSAQGVAGRSSGEAGSAAGGASNGGSASGGGSGGVDYSACTSNDQCEIVPLSCCSCGNTGPVSNYAAVNSKYQATYYNARCAAVDCGPCPPGVNPGPDDPFLYYVASCERPPGASPNAPGHCVVVDLRQTPITACMTASDCSLRSGTGCCSGCGERPVAINDGQASALSDLVCGNEPVGCPLCLPLFTGYTTGCTDGRCKVLYTP